MFVYILVLYWKLITLNSKFKEFKIICFLYRSQMIKGWDLYDLNRPACLNLIDMFFLLKCFILLRNQRYMKITSSKPNMRIMWVIYHHKLEDIIYLNWYDKTIESLFPFQTLILLFFKRSISIVYFKVIICLLFHFPCSFQVQCVHIHNIFKRKY